MAGYIGKISALVTASTADLERKLQGAKGQVNSFGSSLNRTITTAARSAQSSLNDIFTPLQRIQRALSVGSNSRLGLVTPQQVEIIQRAVSVAGEINKPLAAGRKQFESLGQAVQSQFLPALDLAQRRVIGLNDLLERSGTVSEKSFAAVAARVERTTQAIQRLGEAQRIVSTGMTGNELAFFAPNVRDELTRSSQLSQRAGGLSASLLSDGSIARDVQQLANLRNQIISTQATIESGILVNADTRRAEQRLTELLAQSGRLRVALEDRIQVNVDTKQAESAFASIQARFDAIELNRRSGATSRASALAFEDATAGVMSFQSPKDERLIGRRDSTVDDEIARIRELDKEYQKLPVAAQQSLQSQVDRLNEVGNAAKKGSAGVGLLREELAKTATAVRKASLDESSRSLRILSPAELRGQEWSRIAENRKSLANQFRESLGGSGVGGLQIGLDERALRSVAGQVDFLASKLSGLSLEVRGPALAALARYREVAANAFESGAISTDRGRAAVAEARREVVRLSADVLNVNAGRLSDQLKRVGDVSRGAFGNTGLAVQQAIFAIEDFFSVTGSLDQRLRAAGNNISQLGFLIGGTAGLFAGVAISLGGQVVAALVKYITNGKSAKDEAAALTDALSRQKTVVEELRSALSSFTSRIANDVFSKANEGARTFNEELRKVQDQLKKTRLAQAETGNEGTLGASPIAFALRERRRREDAESVERARQRLASQPAPVGAQARLLVEAAAEQQAFLAFFDRGGAFRDRLAQPRAIRLGNIADQIPDGAGIQDRQSQLRLLDQALGVLSPAVEPSLIGRLLNFNRPFADASDEFLAIQQAADLIRRDLQNSLDSAGLELLSSLEKLSKAISSRVSKIEPAVDGGVAGAKDLLASTENLGQTLRDARDSLLASFDIEDVGVRTAAQQAQRQVVDQAQKEFEARSKSVESIDKLTLAADAERESFAAAAAATLQPADANVAAAFQAVLDARQQALVGREGGVREQGQREKELNDQILRGADVDLSKIIEERRRLGLAIERVEQTAKASPAAKELAEIEAALKSRDTPDDERQRLLARQRFVQSRLDLGQQAQLLLDNDVQERLRAIQAVADAQAAAARGREAALTDAGRDAVSLRNIFGDLVAAREAFDITPEEADLALARAFEDTFRRGAPAILALADAASTTRPSRAALEASDISTAEGARELNRLLRGEDSAKDVNLAELRVQSRYLQELVELARENRIPIAD